MMLYNLVYAYDIYIVKSYYEVILYSEGSILLWICQ
jgi:hypothetical protein